MESEAERLGKDIVDKERELDRLFAGKSANIENLSSALKQIGSLQADLRLIHLKAHLEERLVLTEEQIAEYDSFRGYAAREASSHGGCHHGQ